MRTRVRSRFGLIQGMSRVPGYEGVIDREDLTAAAGPVLAIDRTRFLALGGYDPIYFPGRIEDLDLGFRSWMAGYRGYYVPESVAYHKGFATFEPQLGKDRCDELASRNTLIFMWKNTSGRRLLAHFLWLPIRIVYALLCGRFSFAKGFWEALSRARSVLRGRRLLAAGQGGWVERQEAFFRRFEW
jgi:N-acetylglucosaminyl-diphospho-decaprenol L-rhamnosyltransferase